MILSDLHQLLYNIPWQVNFLQGTDGSVPWVWVMGEHKDDLSYEELVS